MRATLSCLLVSCCLAGCFGEDGEFIVPRPRPVGGTPSPSRSQPRVAMDVAGNGIVAWNAGAAVMASRFDGPVRTWGPDETAATGVGDIVKVSVAMHGFASATVVWAQGDRCWSVGYDRTRASWEAAPTQLDRGLEPASEPMVSAYAASPLTSEPFAVWREVVVPDPFTAHAAGFAAEMDSGVWQRASHLDTGPGQTGSRPQNIFGLRVATAGNSAVAVWGVHIDATREQASFATRFNGSFWEDPKRLGPAEGAPGNPQADGMPDIGLDGQGSALAVYVANERVWSRRQGRYATQWETPRRLDDHPGIAVTPRLAVNAAGKAVAVWTKRGGRVYASRSAIPGAGWSPSQIIDIDSQGNATSDGSTPPTSLRVGIDAAGRARVLWSVNNQVWTIEFDGSSWGFAESLGIGTLTDIAMAPGGRAIGVWWNNDGLQRRVWEGPPAPPPAYGGTILFASDYFSGDLEICTSPAEGSQTTRKTVHSAADSNPVWSPDGSRFCFVSNRDAPSYAPDATDLYIRESNGQVTRLTFMNVDGGSARDPTWSPDGSEIAFAGRWGNHEAIRIVHVTTKNHRSVSGGSYDRQPSWSHDSTHVVYSDQGDLLLADVALDASQTPTVVVSRANSDESPAFSPDGQKIVFAARGPLAQGIQLIDLTTGTVLPLTNTADDRQPAWSPDGQDIVFVRDSTDGPRLWIVDAQGQSAHEIAGQVGDSHDPDWKN